MYSAYVVHYIFFLSEADMAKSNNLCFFTISEDGRNWTEDFTQPSTFCQIHIEKQKDPQRHFRNVIVYCKNVLCYVIVML